MEKKKSKPLGRGDASPSRRRGRFSAFGCENGVNLLSGLSPANSVSLTDHCLIYKRMFNIHAGLEGICQLLLKLFY